MKKQICIAPFPPKKIISLVPSQTELLFAIGADEKVVGITRFCVHPKGMVSKTVKIGGTKKLHLEKIVSLKPDLIIGNKEENNENQIKELAHHFPLWMSDVKNLGDALEMIAQVGLLTDCTQKASAIATVISQEFLSIKEASEQKRVLYLIWKNPWMAAGHGTFIHDMLTRCSFQNACCQNRYPQLLSEEITALKPDVIFLSSEPFPFRKKHLKELQELSPCSRIILVDGELFSWYGSRLRLSPAYFRSLQKELA